VSRSRLQIMHDIGVCLVELPSDRVEVVPALGDRQRDDLHLRVGHPLDDGLRVVGGE
jgi:hypothetical protein